jgi:hypothetical protein
MNSEDFDRPSLAISPIAEAQGKFPVYVSCTHYLAASKGGGTVIEVYKSDGDGSPFERMGSELGNPNTNQNQGSSLAVDPSGALWLAYAELNASSWRVQRIWIKSAQMGSGAWTTSHDVEANQIGTTGDGKNFWIKSQQIRVESFPRIAVDNSISGNNGTVYVTWANRSSLDGSSDILVKKKPSGGNWAWGNGVTGTDDQFCPAIAVGPDGTWSLLYYGISSGQDEVYVRHKTWNPAGGVTNDLDVGKIPKFKITDQYKPFIGDYNGVALWYGKSFGVWTEARALVGGESPQQSYFGSLNSTEVLPTGFTKTNVSQVDLTDAPYGLVGKWTSSQFIGYKVPYDFRWSNSAPYNSQVLHADPGFKSGTVEKYHSWLNQPDVVNHRTFTIAPGTNTLKAQAQTAYDATALGSFVESSAQGGLIHFKDPWLPDDNSDGKGYRNRGTDAIFESVGSGSNNLGLATSHKGVFLNQGGSPPNLTPPYYSVRAAESQTVNGQPWVFWTWDTSGVTLTSPTNLVSGYYESPVIFRPWGTRTVTARYKAHLASNATDVMTAGGQRRLVAGSGSYPNTDHLLVYGSAGSIWASYKAGSGAWGNEVCISGSGSNHASPSVSWGGTYQPAVWRSGASGNYSVLFNKRTSGSWLASPVTVASGVSSDPAPQIAFRTLPGSMTRRPHVAYRTSNTGIAMRWSTDDGSSWSNSSAFTDNDGIGAFSLSAVNTLDDFNSILTLAYVSSMRAYVRDFQGSWGSRVLVPASVGENRVEGGFEPTMTDNVSLQVVRHEFTDRTEVAINQYQEYFDGIDQWLTKYYNQGPGAARAGRVASGMGRTVRVHADACVC